MSKAVLGTQKLHLFQIADVDSGLIHWVNADCVQKIPTSGRDGVFATAGPRDQKVADRASG